mmetsp:Transcript_14623/g.24956  ORF Transcript_14623/g.24956 Transcript_14623/m.24956 type:complete len:498 (-) Transcript_14623:8-1501(-)
MARMTLSSQQQRRPSHRLGCCCGASSIPSISLSRRFSALAAAITVSLLMYLATSLHVSFLQQPRNDNTDTTHPSAPKPISTPIGLYPSRMERLLTLLAEPSARRRTADCVNTTLEDRRRLLGRSHCFVGDYELLASGARENDTVRMPEYDFRNVSFGHVTVLRHVYVHGEVPAIFDCSTVFVPTGCGLQLPCIVQRQFPIEKSASAVRLGAAVLLAQKWSNAYYHFQSETIPRAAMVHELLTRRHDLVLLMPSTSVTRYMLAFLQIDPSRIVPFHQDTMYYAEVLVVPSGTPCGRMTPLAGRQLRDMYRRRISELFPDTFNDASNFTRLISNTASDLGQTQAQVSPQPNVHEGRKWRMLVHDRGRGNVRSIVNHVQLVSELRSAFPDAHVVEFGPSEPMDVAIRQHHVADLIIAPHGAGLSNMIFSRDHTIVVEIHPLPNDKENKCHVHTAAALGLRRKFVRANNGNMNSPFVANITDVLKAVREVVNEARQGKPFH